ncbi:hypothetical protein JCM10207_006623 [Rhodosporidiobolus poonsookiae]
MAASAPANAILLEIQAPFAIITFNQPHKKNALDSSLYKRLSSLLREVDRNPEVFFTVLTGKGDFFSAGADVKAAREGFAGENARVASLGRLSESNMDLTRSFYRHSKILIALLNGPAVGLSAALLGHFDFIYAVESAYFLTPFAAISLVAEGGASLSLVQRMGLAKANEALIMGKKLSAKGLHASGFINGLFPPSSAEEFRKNALAMLEQQFSGLDLEASLGIKRLIRVAQPDPEETNCREVFAGADRFATGKPQALFAKLASKQMRHKI